VKPLGNVVTQYDMWFHQPRYRDYRWLETNWFSWLIPEERMRCHLRAAFRTNLGVVQQTCFVFSDPDPVVGELGADYADVRNHVPMPPHNLNDYKLTSGMAVKVLKPMKEWSVRFDGLNDTMFDLHYRALMPPVHISESVTEDSEHATIAHGHLDQTMMVTGTVRIAGRDLTVNFPSQRDHSWSPRPEEFASGYGIPMSGNFDSGHFGEDFTFFVQTRNPWENLERGIVHNGYILDHGELLRLKHGEGRYTYEDNGWATTYLEYELEDEKGRTHLFKGEPVSLYRNGVGTLAVVKWTTEGKEVGWGEYNWHGDIVQMRKMGSPTPGR
jgi:hypothetical protein